MKLIKWEEQLNAAKENCPSTRRNSPTPLDKRGGNNGRCHSQSRPHYRPPGGRHDHVLNRHIKESFWKKTQHVRFMGNRLRYFKRWIGKVCYSILKHVRDHRSIVRFLRQWTCAVVGEQLEACVSGKTAAATANQVSVCYEDIYYFLISSLPLQGRGSLSCALLLSWSWSSAHHMLDDESTSSPVDGQGWRQPGLSFWLTTPKIQLSIFYFHIFWVIQVLCWYMSCLYNFAPHIFLAIVSKTYE